MTTSQMSTFKGGAIIATQGAYSPDHGTSWVRCPDREDTVLKCKEYLINDVWYGGTY
ncbi:hypothetical protein MP477_02840 [Chryseobacterium sp. WG23]|nr:hypothetical protein [Chryseobacterium sp. WG23]MCQ9633886.1 hypothetical protein [Chryseobacterium sp. WG23]